MADIKQIRAGRRHARLARVFNIGPNQDQPIRLRIRERLQNNGIEHAEDRGVGAYTEGQRKNRNRSETRVHPQHAQAIVQIGP